MAINDALKIMELGKPIEKWWTKKLIFKKLFAVI